MYDQNKDARVDVRDLNEQLAQVIDRHTALTAACRAGVQDLQRIAAMCDRYADQSVGEVTAGADGHQYGLNMAKCCRLLAAKMANV